ncbi:MAG: hypothetical protein ACFB4I_15175 [Cyanophyceae cyanobacterium]
MGSFLNLLKEVKMTTNPLSLAKQVTKTTSPALEKKENFVPRYVILPGALGGLTKIVMEVKETTTAPLDQSRPQINVTSLSYLVPSSIFLGVMSSLIGMFVLSDFLYLKKSKLKVFGLSLLFGLFFPLVFETASNTLQLQNEIEELQEEKVQVEEIAISNAMLSSSAPSSLESIESIEELAIGTTNFSNQEMAIENIEEIAKNSQDTLVSQEALAAIANIARRSPHEPISPEAIQAIEKVAIQSNSSEVRELAVRTLESLKGQISTSEDVLDEAIARILS